MARGDFHIKVKGQTVPLRFSTYALSRFAELEGVEDIEETFARLNSMNVKRMIHVLRASDEFKYIEAGQPLPEHTDFEIMQWIDENGGIIDLSMQITAALSASVEVKGTPEKKRATGKSPGGKSKTSPSVS